MCLRRSTRRCLEAWHHHATVQAVEARPVSAGRGTWGWRAYHVSLGQEGKEVQCGWGTGRCWNWLDEKTWHKAPGCGRGKWEWLERGTTRGVRRNKVRTCWARTPVRSLRWGLEDWLRQEERGGGTNSTPNLVWNRDAWKRSFLCFQHITWGNPPAEVSLVLVLTSLETAVWLLWARSGSFPTEVCLWQVRIPQLCWWSVWVLVWCQVVGSLLFYLQFQKSAQKVLKNITKTANSSSLEFRLFA